MEINIELNSDNKHTINANEKEKELVAAIILLAISDINKKQKNHRIDAFSYLKSKSFDFHCALLDWSPEYIREKCGLKG